MRLESLTVITKGRAKPETRTGEDKNTRRHKEHKERIKNVEINK